jgi:KUP system potassium uptake protein
LLKITPTHENVLGILSLILWSLILIVFIRYIGMVMRISHGGEGGILALLAFILPPVRRGVLPKATWLTFLIILGAGLLFGDGIITPAVSVLSSVEGLGVATPDAQPFVVPIAVGILAALFVVQHRGTQRIGSVFGPIMLAWFVTIAALGTLGIARYPAALWAFDPLHIFRFFAHHGVASIAIFGAIVLCVSGVEALYADMSHFGRAPIAVAWTAIVFPALALNYIGQGALVLADPRAISNPFYLLTPRAALYPVVAIATIATIIASQALISGVFTMSKQGISLDFIPRMRVIFTSVAHRGQVYVPFVNRLLAVACIALVIAFGSSTRLASAYGLAVAGTMVVTSVAYFEVVRTKFRWSLTKALLSTAPFFALELLFVAGSLPKIIEGGWIPILVSVVVFIVASTWREGRRRIAHVLRQQSRPVAEFLQEVRGRLGVPYHGTAVFLTGDPEGIPFVLRHHWARMHSFDEKIVLLTIVPSTDPYVSADRRVQVEWLAEGLVRVTACFGFMERLDLERIIHSCAVHGLHIGGMDTTYYSADVYITPLERGIIHNLQRNLFVVLRRNARSLNATLGIPADAHAKLGVEVPY